MRSATRKARVREMLDKEDAIHPSGKNHQGRGLVGNLPITIHPGSGANPPVVETALGPAGGHSPLEALMHQAEMVAELFSRRGYDTADVEIAYEFIQTMVKIRRAS